MGSGLGGLEKGSLDWGDYNNDGQLDALITGADINGIPTAGVYVKKVITGSASDIITYEKDTVASSALTGVYKSSAAWGDYDNDGDLDILLTGEDANGNRIAKVYKNTGDPGAPFREDTAASAQLPGVSDSRVAWGDYDNDGDFDILITGDTGGGAITRIYENTGDPAATFREVTAASGVLTGVRQGSVAWGDYDGDGDLDILLTGAGNDGSGIAKLYENSLNPAAPFRENTSVSVILEGVWHSSAAWGDYDGDGDLDIILSGNNGSDPVSKAYTNTGGGFIEDTVFSPLLENLDKGRVVMGDYDHDGDLDVLISGADASNTARTIIYENRSSPVNADPGAPVNLSSTLSENRLTLSWDPGADSETPAAGLTYNLRIGTTPGGTDILSPMAATETGFRRVADPGNVGHNTEWTLDISDWSTGKDYYWSVQSIDNHFSGSPFAAEAGFSIPPNIVLSNTTVAENQPDQTTVGTFSTTDPDTGTTPVYSLVSGPGDDDNASFTVAGDVLKTAEIFDHDIRDRYSIRVKSDDGNGVIHEKTFIIKILSILDVPFTEVLGLPFPDIRAAGIAWGDYDDDGDLDLLLSGRTGTNTPMTRVYKNTGIGFVEDSAASASLMDVYESSVAWSDYDNDGDLDILLSGGNFPALSFTRVYENTGSGFNENSTASSILPQVRSGSVDWGDYDNDGDLDILITGKLNAAVYANTETGFIEDRAAGDVLEGVSFSSAAWGDFDIDGRLDILLTGQNRHYEKITKIYRNTRNGFVEYASLAGLVDGSVDWGDYDGDGDLDFLLTGTTNFTTSSSVTEIYENTGTGFIKDTQASRVLEAVGFGTGIWGDYDNDGDLDILLTGAGFSGSIAKIYSYTDSGFVEDTAVSKVLTGATDSMAAWGDHDNDGDLDILLTGFPARLYVNNAARINTPPGPPANLIAAYEDEILTVAWDAAADTETDSPGLTYNLRIGLTPGGTEIVSPMAFIGGGTDGLRKVPARGNTGHATGWALDMGDLPAGVTYYWSVQAIDNSFAGSAFEQEESVFIAVDILLSSTQVGENLPVGTPFATLRPGGKDTGKHYTYSLVSGAGDDHNGLFTIEGDKLKTAAIFDRLVRDTYRIRIRAVDDAGAVVETQYTITVVDNQPPTDIFLSRNSIGENQPAGTEVGAFTTADPDSGDTHTYSLAAGTGDMDNHLFTIDGNILRSAVVLSFENGNVYTIRVETDDGKGGIYSKAFSVSVIQPFTEVSGAVLEGVSKGGATWGDYDNDGDLDVLLSGDNGVAGGTTRIYENRGDGFVEDAAASAALLNVTNSSVAWGDYDNDGDLDILLTGRKNSRVYENTGNGFGLYATLAGVDSGSAVWGDYDNDGDLDILLKGDAAGSEKIARIYKNTGSGFIEDPGASAALTGVFFSTAAWGDYDNDEDLDIVIAGWNAGFQFIANVYNNADGIFSEDAGASLPLRPFYPGTVAWGDYDNDGDLDILLSGGLSTEVYENTGNGFTKDTTASADLPWVNFGSAAWGDYDNDGDLDIFITGSYSSNHIARLYENTGNGYREDTFITSEIEGVYKGSAAWGDYDNDGDLDILVTGENSDNQHVTRIYQNRSIHDIMLPGVPVNLSSTRSGSRLTLSWEGGGNPSVSDGQVSYNIMVGTTPGGADIVSPMADVYTGRRQIPANGNVNHNTSWTLDISDLDQNAEIYWGVQAVDHAFAGSFFELAGDNNPPTDISLDNDSVLEQMPPGTVVGAFTTRDLDATDTHTYSLVSGTGDEDNDAFAIAGDTLTTSENLDYTLKQTYHIRVRTDDGNDGVFAKAFTITLLRSPFPQVSKLPLRGVMRGSAAWGDYDNDGNLDILLTGVDDTGASLTRIYRNTENGSGFTDHAAFAGIDSGSAVWGDYDNDGDLDILITGADDKGSALTRIFQNTDGTFSEEPSASLVLDDLFFGSAAWGDYDNDGDLDILLTGTSDETAAGALSKIYENTQNGFQEDPEASASLVGVFHSAVAWGDYDNDGDIDIVITGRSASGLIAGIYKNNGGIFAEDNAAPTPAGIEKGSAAWGDYDADGDLDLLIAGLTAAGGSARVYKNTGDGFAEDTTAFAVTGIEDGSAAWGDYDNDGDLDILITGYVSGSASLISKVYEYTGNGFREDETVSLILSDVRDSRAAWGDYDGDGDLDILLTGDDGANRIAKVYKNNILTPNTRPQAPTGLGSTISGNALTLSWDAATDAETADLALTYNLSVGTDAGAVNVVSPMADRTLGVRWIPAMGYAGHNTGWTLDIGRYPPGTTFYWSVQAIDSAFAGSAFAVEDTITSEIPNQPPIDITLDEMIVPEQQLVGTGVGSFTAVDADVNDTHTFHLISGTGDDDNPFFTIDGDQLKTGAVFDYDSKDRYSIRVQTRDNRDEAFEAVFEINISDVNFPPTDITLSGNSVDEGSPLGAIVGTFTTVDADPSDSHTYSLVPGQLGGVDDDNASFAIQGHSLITRENFDHETKDNYNIHVQTDDGNGGIFKKWFAITINNIHEAPTDLQLTVDTVAENQSVGTVVGVLSTIDSDTGDAHTYSLVPGTDDDDNDRFTISGDKLLTAAVFDLKIQAAYRIRVRATDGNGASYDRVLTITVKSDQPNLVLWNTLGSDFELKNSLVGAALTPLQTLEFAQSEYGDGIDSDNDDPVVSIPGDVLNVDEGTIALWVRLVSVPPIYPTGTLHRFLFVEDSSGLNIDLNLEFSSDDGAGHSGWIGGIWEDYGRYSVDESGDTPTAALGVLGERIFLSIRWNRNGLPDHNGEKIVLFRNDVKIAGFYNEQIGAQWGTAFSGDLLLNNALYDPAVAGGTVDLDLVYDDIKIYDVSLSDPALVALYTDGSPNSAPVMDTSGNPYLAAIDEDDTGNAGTRVSDILATLGGSGIADADGDTSGIAVTALVNANGTWQYDPNGGNEWQDFQGVSADSARLLAPGANIRFVPVSNYHGIVNPGISFRAWDRSSHANGSTADTTTNGGSSAFSAELETAGILVRAVNDPPSVDTNTGSTVNAGDGIVIENTMLRASDVEGDPSEDIVYTLTIRPGKGELQKSGIRLEATDTFTQADIDDQRITYTATDDARAGDRFGFTVTDAGGAVSGEAEFIIRLPNLYAQLERISVGSGSENYLYGRSVAIGGGTMAVGAPYGGSSGAESGAVYMYAYDASGTGTWRETAILTPADGALDDRFGISLAMSGDILVIGASEDDDNGGESGSAYVYARDVSNPDQWNEVKKLTPSDGAAGDRFGFSVTISGDTIAVGSVLDDDDTIGADSGSVYLFYRNADGPDTWGQVKKLTAGDGAAGDRFGVSVAADGDTLVVGSFLNDTQGLSTSIDTNLNYGSAYVFERNAGGDDQWGEVKKVTTYEHARDDQFGVSVAISGDTVVVGAFLDNTDNGIDSGSAYVFERDADGSGQWGVVKKLTASNGAANDSFGVSVAISGDTIAVGAHLHDEGGEDTGSVYVFKRNDGGDGNWGQVAELTAGNGTAGDHFGRAVAVSDDTLVVGADKTSENGIESGAAYVFDATVRDIAVSSPSRIVFWSERDGNSEIYVMDADGSNPTRLTNNPAADRSPDWSPDGSRIAFDSYRDGNREIYVMDADGTNPTRLTNNTYDDAGPVWSPDGTKIAFFNYKHGRTEVYVMDADGSNQIRLTGNSGYQGWNYGAVWSPDGNRIAFRSDNEGNSNIWIMDADGSNLDNVTNSIPAWEEGPAWSPDGSAIAFHSQPSQGQPWDIWVMAADGSNPVNLTVNPNFSDTNPAWSSDDTRIVFQSQRDGDAEIYLMAADGSNPVNLTNSPDSNDGGPKWKDAVVSEPILSVSRTSIDFADITLGDTATEQIIVTNSGDAELNVSSIAISGDQAGSFDVDQTPFVLSPGASMPLGVDFTPDVFGEVTASLDLESDGGSASVNLTGHGAFPSMFTFDNAGDFTTFFSSGQGSGLLIESVDGGIDNTRAVDFSSSGAPQIWTLQRGFPGDLPSWSASVFFKFKGGIHHITLGFSAEPNPAHFGSGAPQNSISIGVSAFNVMIFKGGFQQGRTDHDGLLNNNWYFLKMDVEYTGSNRYNVTGELFQATSNGVVGASIVSHTISGLVEATLAADPEVYNYFSSSNPQNVAYLLDNFNTTVFTEINTAPVADPQTVSATENLDKAITLTGSDSDGDQLDFIVLTQPSHGALSGTAPNLIYTPEADYFGPDSFTFKVNDGHLDSNAATVTINVEHAVMKGDVDDSGTLDLKDVILALQIASGMTPAETVYPEADANNDGRIGIEEAIYVLQTVAGIRSQ